MPNEQHVQFILDHAPTLLQAMHHFHVTAHHCMALLAHDLGVPVEVFAERYFRFHLTDHYEGILPQGWSYYFHGSACCFQHRTSGQRLEVKLGYLREFGVLDPYFFWQFVTTTPA
jgi:hypothetical protein